jgi:hypothetical protein
MTSAATQQNTNGTPAGQIKEALVVAPNTAELQAKYDLGVDPENEAAS